MDSSHRCRDSLQNFLHSLGEFNDKYWMASSEELKTDIISNLNNIELPINFNDTSEFKKYATNALSTIEILLQENKLPISEFHSLRKKLQLFFKPLANFSCGKP